MVFPSLADELADAFDQGGTAGGRSLADEFGIDGDLDNDMTDRGESTMGLEYAVESESSLTETQRYIRDSCGSCL